MTKQIARNLNQMSKEELLTIKGISEQTAERIIARRQQAELRSLDELLDVQGMNRRKLNLLKQAGLICALPATSTAPAVSRTSETTTGEKSTGETFACRSCGRILPVMERETSNYFNPYICNACYSNLAGLSIPTGGA